MTTDDPVSFDKQPRSTSLTLLQRVQKNEAAAWEMLVEVYAPMVYSRCRQQWKLPAPDAENIGQEVFASVARKVSDFRRQRTGSFRCWLRTIIDNKCRDHFRSKQVARAQGGSQHGELLDTIPEDTDVATDTEVLSNEKAVVMRQAIKRVENEFSTRDWKIFWSIVVDGRSRQDIAAELEVSDNVIYLVYSRVRKRMKEIYQDLFDDELLIDSFNN